MTYRTCTLTDCENKHTARGFCKKHYYAAGFGYTPKPCRVAGCELMTTNKTGDGLCENHYALQRRNGTVVPTKFYPTKQMTVADVLHQRSELHGDCVLWTGKCTSDGYPQTVTGQGLADRAHRLSWLLANGPIPDGLTIDHVCHTDSVTCPGGLACTHRRCINPDHLEPVTQAENSRRLWSRDRAHETDHSPAGH